MKHFRQPQLVLTEMIFKIAKSVKYQVCNPIVPLWRPIKNRPCAKHGQRSQRFYSSLFQLGKLDNEFIYFLSFLRIKFSNNSRKKLKMEMPFASFYPLSNSRQRWSNERLEVRVLGALLSTLYVTPTMMNCWPHRIKRKHSKKKNEWIKKCQFEICRS